MIGPEWVAQQKKLVASRIRNCGERSASPIDISPCTAPSPAGAAAACASAGGRRTRNETGIMMAPTTSATICIEVRQSWPETSQAASGAIVIGAMPMPAETSDTARLRWVSNQPVTVAIIGAKIAAVAPPTMRPNNSWNSINEVARLASASDTAITVDPVSTTGSGPNRSDKVPQTMLVSAIARNPMVMALETPATDQPVSCVMDWSSTGSENMP